jgi:outer membrane protein assembly factor BamD
MQLKKVFLIILAIFLSSCSNKEESKVSVIEKKDMEYQMIDSYKKGLKYLDEGDVLSAAKKFNEAELLFPQSEWAPKSSLMAAYSYYTQGYYFDGINELEMFFSKYPKDDNINYAYYLLALCYYEQIVDETKDLKPIIKSKEYFEILIKDYPETEFAIDAAFKLELINEVMAAKEMYLAMHYIKKRKWIAAINRYKIVLKKYDNTIYIEEALHRLVEIHYNLGLIEDSENYAKLLGYNYQSGEWYKLSYKVFNKDYKKLSKNNKNNKINKKSDNKKRILEKFRSIFF